VIPSGYHAKMMKRKKMVGFLCHIIMPSTTGITGIPHMGHCSGNVAASSDINLTT